VLKTHLNKHQPPLDPTHAPEFIIGEAKKFMKSLDDLRNEILVRDAAYKKAKESKNSDDMAHYRELAQTISKKCLDYGRDLCEAPIPNWVDGNLSKDNMEITRRAYDVIRNKICGSLKVFDSDLLPNAKILMDFAEGKF
jgi:hypothetical protein